MEGVGIKYSWSSESIGVEVQQCSRQSNPYVISDRTAMSMLVLCCLVIAAALTASDAANQAGFTASSVVDELSPADHDLLKAMNEVQRNASWHTVTAVSASTAAITASHAEEAQ